MVLLDDHEKSRSNDEDAVAALDCVTVIGGRNPSCFFVLPSSANKIK